MTTTASRALPPLPLDAALAALQGPHRGLALGDGGLAVRYHPDVAPFAALIPGPTAEAWRGLSALPGDRAAILAESAVTTLPDDWQVTAELDVVQMSGELVQSGPGDPEIVSLNEHDTPAMLALAALTRPGPFGPRTIDLGGYVGIHHDGALVAMAGRRMHPAGWIEASAICTDPSQRGRGLGRRVAQAVVRGIREDGGQPFLHVMRTNPARRLYEAMGFTAVRAVRVIPLQRVGA